MSLQAIAAVSADLGIGKGGQLLFHIAEDLAEFKRLTLGGTVIMGRKTLESLPGGKPLPGRVNVVLSRNQNLRGDGIVVVHSEAELLSLLQNLPEPHMLIGGASLYRALLPQCSCLLLTEVDRTVPADAYFPEIRRDPTWHMESATDWRQDGELRYRFCRWIRTRPIEQPEG